MRPNTANNLGIHCFVSNHFQQRFGLLPVRWQRSRFAPAWSYAVGNYVYGIREDDQGERVVVRSRLVIAGED